MKNRESDINDIFAQKSKHLRKRIKCWSLLDNIGPNSITFTYRCERLRNLVFSKADIVSIPWNLASKNIYNTLEFIGLSSINFCGKFYTKHVKYRDTICHTLKFFCLPAFHVRYQKPLPKTIIFKASQVICRSSTRILSRSVANHKGKQKKK